MAELDKVLAKLNEKASADLTDVHPSVKAAITMLVDFLKTDSSSDAAVAGRVSALESKMTSAESRLTSVEGVASEAKEMAEAKDKYDNLSISFDDATNKLSIQKDVEGESETYLVDAEMAV